MSSDTELLALEREKQLLITPKDNTIYYVITKDNKGNCLSFNFSGSESNLPFEGFEEPVPEYFKPIILELLEKGQIEGSFEKQAQTIYVNQTYYKINLTGYPFIFKGQQLYQYIIRQTSTGILGCPMEKSKIDKNTLSEINSRCISSVSHDFRTPLSIIYANLQLLEHHELELDKETIHDTFSLSRMAVKSLLKVLDKVTVIDSINKGRLEYKPSTVCLQSICNSLVRTINEAEVIPERLKYIHDPSISEVELDEYLFTNLFTHLISNSLSYSKRDCKVLFESLRISENEIRFTVKDQGIGLTTEQIGTLRSFFANSETEMHEGIGLGMVIVRECLTLHNGSIAITSERGNGSIFTIDLPVK